MSQQRISSLRRQFTKENLDGIIIRRADHIFYLCGYTGSNGLLVITDKTTFFLTDFRYTEQAKKEVKGAKVHIMTKGDLVACLSEFAPLMKKNLRFGIAAEHLSLAGLNKLATALPDALTVPADSLLAELGWVKDAYEIKQIAKAAQIGDIAFERVLGLVKPGVREREIAAELEYQMKMLGATKPSFDSIVASGYRSAMPHGEASDKKIDKGDFITFDFGAVVNRYVSDMTRTIVVGKATSRQKKIYNIVLKAQKAGVAKVRAGVKASAVDEACRKIITKAGYGKEFGHGTGHGIGVYFDPIHQGPRLAAISEDKLKVNNVITVEPGIYITGWGGVRIEDDVVVTRTGCRVLTKSPKYLLEL
jgi:Xaa-Pro aminopeptidase